MVSILLETSCLFLDHVHQIKLEEKRHFPSEVWEPSPSHQIEKRKKIDDENSPPRSVYPPQHMNPGEVFVGKTIGKLTNSNLNSAMLIVFTRKKGDVPLLPLIYWSVL